MPSPRPSLLHDLRESFHMALEALGAHKLRSALTLLGVVVGVFSIIMVMTAIRVLQNNIETNMSQLGADTFQIQRWPAFLMDNSQGGFEKYLRRRNITIEQANLLKKRVPEARNIGVHVRLARTDVSSAFARSNPDIEIAGVTPETFATRNWPIEEGRALVESDVENARLVCVLGWNLARHLFPHGSAIGQTVKIHGLNYTVVGVVETKGTLFGQDQDRFATVPVTTGLNRYGRHRSLSIQVQAHNRESFDDTMEQVRGALRVIRKVEPGADDDFDIFSNDSLIERFRTLTLAIRAGAGFLSSIALVAAGVGIMNIMLVSVTERTREIGIRRAIGARKRNIKVQFLMEAVVLCEIGGVAGILLGMLAGNATAWHFAVPPVFPVDWAMIGLVICSVVGIAFGTYPAIKAANLDPIDSLRYE